MVGTSLDAVIIGECHGHGEQPYKIVDIILRYKPEYVLYEAFSKKDVSNLLNKKNEMTISLLDLFKIYRISPEEAGFTKEVLNKEKLKEQLLKVMMNVSPDNIFRKIYLYHTFIDLKYLLKNLKTYEDIIREPLAAYHPAILDYFLEILKNKCGELKELEEKLLNSGQHNKYLNVLNTHLKFENMYKIIEYIKVISKSYREYLLDPTPRVSIILSAVYKVGAKIGECDSDEHKMAAIENYRQHLKKLYKLGKLLVRSPDNNHKSSDIKKLENEIEELAGQWYNLNNLREEAMANSIEKYVKKRKTNAPIIAIMGKAHAKKVAKLLKERGIRCKVIELRDTVEDPELKEIMGLMYSINFIGDYLR